MDKNKKYRVTWVQLCWAVAGLALLAAGLYVVNVPDNELISVVDKLGLAMLFAGCINLFVYIKERKIIHGAQWLVADGMCTSLLSIFLFFNEITFVAIIPFFFGMWELFSGVLKFIEAMELREARIGSWRWFMSIGLAELLSGVGSLVKPIDEAVGMNHVIAVILFIQVCGYVYKFHVYHHLAEKGNG